MVYLFLADGFETIEALTPVDMMRRAGVPVTTVSITDNLQVVSAQGIAVTADARFSELGFADAEMLVLPGGLQGTRNLGNFEPLCSMLKSFNAKGGNIAAICAAPSILQRLGILDGHTATIYPGCQLEYGTPHFTESFVEHDGNIITGKGPAAAADFGAEILATLVGRQACQKIVDGMLFSQKR